MGKMGEHFIGEGGGMERLGENKKGDIKNTKVDWKGHRKLYYFVFA